LQSAVSYLLGGKNGLLLVLSFLLFSLLLFSLQFVKDGNVFLPPQAGPDGIGPLSDEKEYPENRDDDFHVEVDSRIVHQAVHKEGCNQEKHKSHMGEDERNIWDRFRRAFLLVELEPT
jgi:hypothetical protein